MLKNLRQFITFNWEAFAKDKVFVCTGVKPWLKYENGEKTNERLGTSVEAVIFHDKTKYESASGEDITNRFEKLTFKVPAEITIPLDKQIVPVDVQARVWGDFQNNLSIEASRVDVVEKG